jgi:Effector-associated domain 1
MKLSGSQREELQSALVSAFPRKSSLEQLLSHKLEEMLHKIPLEGSVKDIIFKLIQEAEAYDLTETLVRAAREENPGNEELKVVEKELFPNLKTKSLLQKGRQNLRPDSPEVSVKLDSDMIINFDLREMIIKFQGKFKQTSGVFAFSVDGDYTILKQYILERIKRELKHITKRPNEMKYVSLNWKKVSHHQDIEKHFLEKYTCECLTNLFDEHDDSDILLIVWNRNNRAKNMKILAQSFWTEVIEPIQVIAKKQNRCIVLIWANEVQKPSRSSLNGFTLLPTPDILDCDELENYFRSQLRNKVEEANINRYLENLNYHEGDVVNTYREWNEIMGQLHYG